jgi:hypothetical protein
MSQLRVREPRLIDHTHEAEAAPSRERTTRRSVTLAALVVVALALLVVLLDLASRHIFGGNSDDATLVLQGQSMSSAHPTLGGWDLSYDSFWTIDILFYTLAVRLLGVGPDLLNLVPAVIAALLVFASVLLTRQGRSDRGFLAGAALVVALLALPGPELSFFLLQGGWHAATTLWCLLVFACVSRSSGRWTLVAATALVAAGLLGDLLTLTLVIAPLLLGAVLSWRRARNWRAGRRHVIAAVGGTAVALVVRAIAVAVGTYAIGSRSILAVEPQTLANLRAIPGRLAALFGVSDIVPGVTHTSPLLRAVHVFLLLIVLVAVVAAIARIARSISTYRPLSASESQSVTFEELLVIAFVADLVSFSLFSTYGSVDFTRYLIPGFVFVAVLAARVLVRVVRSRPTLDPRPLGAIGAIVIVLCAVNFAADSVGGSAPQEARTLSTFLLGKGLTSGVGDYWSSSIVTVDTSDKVEVRPVALGSTGTLQRYTLQSAASWYQGQTFRFFVYDSGDVWQNVTASAAEKSFGTPAATYDVGSYRVLTYPHGFHISS